jgi:hypothetical protein
MALQISNGAITEPFPAYMLRNCGSSRALSQSPSNCVASTTKADPIYLDATRRL